MLINSLAQLQAQTDSQYPLLIVLSIVTLRGVCNYKIKLPHILVLVQNLIGTVFLLEANNTERFNLLTHVFI